MQITIKSLTRGHTIISVDQTDTISQVKNKIENETGIPPESQMIIFGGICLHYQDDSLTMASFSKKDVAHLGNRRPRN